MKKILIADDEPDALKFLEKGLKRNKYSVVATPSGNEVIALARAEKPDLLLLDIAMPGMDGYTLAENLKCDEELKSIPIIFITGKELTPKAVEEMTEEAGAHDYIMKPCSFEVILSKVKAVLG